MSVIAKNSRIFFEILHLEAFYIYFENVLNHTASANSPKIDVWFYSLVEIIEIDRGTGKNNEKCCSKLIKNIYRQPIVDSYVSCIGV